MPPDTPHTVYTPMASFSQGGHFYHYGSMHLMEHAHWVDKDHKDMVTNELHEHTLYVLYLMALSLPMCEYHMYCTAFIHRNMLTMLHSHLKGSSGGSHGSNT